MCPTVNLLLAESHQQGPGVTGSGIKGQEGSLSPVCSAHRILMWPGVREEVPGASTAQ